MKEKIVRAAKERTKIKLSAINKIYDNLTSKNRLTANAMTLVFDNEYSKSDIERVQRYLIQAGAKVVCNKPVRNRKTKTSFFDSGITWGEFNCLPNGELI